MTKTLTCEEIAELLPGFALDALTPEERTAVHSHLESCPSCKAITAAYGAVTLGLGGGVTQRKPPAAVKHALMAKIAPTARKPEAALTRWLRGLWQRQALIARLAIALALLATLIFVALRQPAVENQIMVWRIAANSDTSTALNAVNDSVGAKPIARLQYRGDDRVAAFSADNLPHLPEGKAYVLWLKHRNGKTEKGALFQADATGAARIVVNAPRRMHYYVKYLVTIESADGLASAPSGPAILISS